MPSSLWWHLPLLLSQQEARLGRELSCRCLLGPEQHSERLISASPRSHPKSIGKKILRITRPSTFQTFLRAEFQGVDIGHTPGDGSCTDVVTPRLNSSCSQLFKPVTTVFLIPLRHLLVQGKKERMVKREKKHSGFFKKSSSYQICGLYPIYSEILCGCHPSQHPHKRGGSAQAAGSQAHADLMVPRR